MVSSPDKRYLGLFLANFSFAVGGGWVFILGYLLLAWMGWRNYILFVSIPWFIPPIIMFHIYLTPKFEEVIRKEKEEKETESDEIQEPALPRHTMLIRLLKYGILKFVAMFIGFGVVLLLPSLIRSSNISEYGMINRCSGVVNGKQFLIMACITGGVNVIARCTSIQLFKRFNYRHLMLIFSIIATASFGALTLWNILSTSPNLIMIIVAFIFIVGAWAFMINEIIIAIHDPTTFGVAGSEMGSAVCWGLSFFGASAGNAVASFLTPQIAVIVNFVLSFVQIVITFFLTERDAKPEQEHSVSTG